jgi:site-specific DNA-cytosine methylase
MRVLIACEFSGVVRDAFTKAGHNAWSCDLLPSETNGVHILGDIMHVMRPDWGGEWDLMIAHPPCTHLAVSGARWFKYRMQEQAYAIRFVENLWTAGISRICIENPVGILSTRSILGKPSQIIQPWQFGHGETKATCLWLKNLPPLVPTDIVEGRKPRVHHASPGPDRWKERSRTLPGIARAMAEQWGNLHA